MDKETEEELLDITQRVMLKLDAWDLVMDEEEKDTLESLNNSMSFFLQQGDFGRAVIEGRELIKRLDQILN